MVAAIRGEADAVHEHPAYADAIYPLHCLHPYLFKEILVRLLRSTRGRTVANKADLFSQLAVAFDLLKRPDVPKLCCGMSRRCLVPVQSGPSRPILHYACWLWGTPCSQDRDSSRPECRGRTAPHADIVYGLSPLQVDIA